VDRDDEGCRVRNAGPVDEPGTTGRCAPPSAADEGVSSRREVLFALRRIAVNLETADVLDLRADRSANPALADVLRERAAQRRRTAGRLRADLAAQGVLAYRPRSRPDPATPLWPPAG
jgi:hypothetical protein